MKYEDLTENEKEMEFSLTLRRPEYRHRDFSDKTRFQLDDLLTGDIMLVKTLEFKAGVLPELPDYKLFLRLDYGDCEVADNADHLDVPPTHAIKSWDALPDMDVAGAVAGEILSWIELVRAKLEISRGVKNRKYDLIASREGGRSGALTDYERVLPDGLGGQIWRGDYYRTDLPMQVKIYLLDDALDDGKCSYVIRVNEICGNAFSDRRVAKIEVSSDVSRLLSYRYAVVAGVNMEEKYIAALDLIIEIHENGGLPANKFLLEENGDLVYLVKGENGRYVEENGRYKTAVLDKKLLMVY